MYQIDNWQSGTRNCKLSDLDLFLVQQQPQKKQT